MKKVQSTNPFDDLDDILDEDSDSVSLSSSDDVSINSNANDLSARDIEL